MLSMAAGRFDIFAIFTIIGRIDIFHQSPSWDGAILPGIYRRMRLFRALRGYWTPRPSESAPFTSSHSPASPHPRASASSYGLAHLHFASISTSDRFALRTNRRGLTRRLTVSGGCRTRQRSVPLSNFRRHREGRCLRSISRHRTGRRTRTVAYRRVPHLCILPQRRRPPRKASLTRYGEETKDFRERDYPYGRHCWYCK